MEMHHKLRRDPSWHPNGCNLCGQLGHQAAECPNGTVNWKAIYGEDTFVLRPPVYESQLRERRKLKTVDAADLTRRAEEFAKAALEKQGKAWEEVQREAEASQTAVQPPAAQAAADAGGAAAQPAAAGSAPKPDEGLPEGWAVAHDPNGKPYYWHKATQKVQWDKPTAASAPAPGAKGQQPAGQAPAAAALPAGQQAAGLGTTPCREDSFSRQLAALAPLAAAQQQQQRAGGEGSHRGGEGSNRGVHRAGSAEYGPGPYSVASYDDTHGTDSAASTPRSRSSWAPSHGSHQPPSRGASASGAAEMRSASGGKLRRPPRATSSGLRSALLGEHMQPSFTDSVTNTTNSSEASPRRGGQGEGERDGGDRDWFRSGSGLLDSGSHPLPRLNSDDPGGAARRLGSFGQHSGDGDGASAYGDGASTFGGSSVTGGFGGLRAHSMTSASTAHGRRHSLEPHTAGKMSLLQLQRAIEKIMVSDGEMYAKLQAGLKGIHSLARETDRLRVARDVTGATCINQYVVVKTLGRGSYGKVKLCLNTLDGSLYAIKMMNRSCLLRTLQRPGRAGLRKPTRRSISAGSGIGTPGPAPAAPPAPPARAEADEAGDVNREIAILKKLDHPNVVKLYEVIDPPGSQYMMLVMEFLEKGPVLQTLDQAGFDCLPEEVAADYFRQAVAGLEYLHFHKVVHGDIKPENLLVSSNGELKISDFGCSRMADGKSSHTRLSGTPAFTAPELVSGNAADPFAADVWALGAVLYCFIYGRLPFQGGSVLDVFKAITGTPLALPDDTPISPSLRHLFGRLFDKDPATRITLQEVMAHPWVTDEGRVPLQACADMGLGLIEVTAQEQLGAIDRASVVSMIRARLKEKAFRNREHLFTVGAPMNCVYFVMSGVVEITKTATLDDAERDASAGASIEQSFTVDLDESLMLDCSLAGLGAEGLFPSAAVNGRLHIDRSKARDLRSRQRSYLVEGSEVVIDVKGPGQVVGEVFMQDTPPPCRYSARARGEVLALKLTQENYVRALAAMYYEAENGARAVAASTTPSGRPLPGPSASSPGLLGSGLTAAQRAALVAGDGAGSSAAAAAAGGGGALAAALAAGLLDGGGPLGDGLAPRGAGGDGPTSAPIPRGASITSRTSGVSMDDSTSALAAGLHSSSGSLTRPAPRSSSRLGSAGEGPGMDSVPLHLLAVGSDAEEEEAAAAAAAGTV
ncbi:GRIK2 [Scenedesmus sp. PABB004]|nr:GRIK2 [Scenedesmus sp. PABB004]